MTALTDIRVQLYVDPERRAEFARLMKEPGEVIGFESEVYRRRWERDLDFRECAGVSNADGKPMFYEGTVQDITARKRAEIDLQDESAIHRTGDAILAEHPVRV